MTPTPGIPDASERARLNTAFQTTAAETGFWNEHGHPAPWPDDIEDWTPHTHNPTPEDHMTSRTPKASNP